MSITGRALRIDIGRSVRDVRQALGWSQRDLARRADVAQSTICRIERATLTDLTVETAADVLDALGVRTRIELQSPYIADRGRQKDPGHARCVAYVARRLRRLGWKTMTEVEIQTGNSRGWIDVLAYRESDELLLVIEVKTELLDVGMVLRQVAWYERAAWAAARGHGWLPRQVASALLVLATQASLDRIDENRELLKEALPMNARDLGRVVSGATHANASARSMALLDPYNRSKQWLLPTPLSGRVKPPRYANYAALMARTRS